MKSQTESRVFDRLLLRADTETVNGLTFLHGRAVPYDTPTTIGGWFQEEHAAGSFAKSIKEAARALPLLLFHDARSFPIGKADTWEDGPTGLDGIWKLDSSDEAQRAARLADDEMLSFMSIGFSPIRSEWTFTEEFNPDKGPDYMDKVRRLESRLVETSLVSTPAFKDATVTLVRSADARRREIESQRKLKAWREELAKLR